MSETQGSNSNGTAAQPAAPVRSAFSTGLPTSIQQAPIKQMAPRGQMRRSAATSAKTPAEMFSEQGVQPSLQEEIASNITKTRQKLATEDNENEDAVPPEEVGQSGDGDVQESDPVPESDDNQEEQAAAPEKQKEQADEDTPPKGPGSHRRWKELKLKEKELQNVKAELEKVKQSKVEKQAAAVDTTEHESLKKNYEAIVEELRMLDIERDPEFKQRIKGPLESSLKEASDLVQPELKQSIESALKMEKIADVYKRLHEIQKEHDLEPWQMDALKAHANSIIPLAKQHREAISRSKELFELREKQRAEQEIASQRLSQQIVDAQIQAAASEPSLQKYFDTATDKSKAETLAMVGRIKQMHGALRDPEEGAKAAVWSHIGPKLHQEVVQLRGELEKLSQNAKKVRRLSNEVEPSDRTVVSGSGSDETDDTENVSLSADAILKRIRAGI